MLLITGGDPSLSRLRLPLSQPCPPQKFPENNRENNSLLFMSNRLLLKIPPLVILLGKTQLIYRHKHSSLLSNCFLFMSVKKSSIVSPRCQTAPKLSKSGSCDGEDGCLIRKWLNYTCPVSQTFPLPSSSRNSLLRNCKRLETLCLIIGVLNLAFSPQNVEAIARDESV